MKKYFCILLVFSVFISSNVICFSAEEVKASGAVEYGYTTTTLVEFDTQHTAPELEVELTVPNYMGTISAYLSTSEGSGNVDVIVLYVPDDKWVSGCYYNGITADITRRGAVVYPISDSIIYWKELYNYGFLSLSGGVYASDFNSIQMHFTHGPGLYTGLATVYYSYEYLGYSTATELVTLAPEKAMACAAGFPFVLLIDDSTIDYYRQNNRIDYYGSYDWPELGKLLDKCSYEIKQPDPVEGLKNFKETKKYYTGIFIDVENCPPEDVWASEDIFKAYRLGLINGTGGGMFSPGSTVTVEQAIALASRIHNIYYGLGGAFNEEPGNWSKIYINYALSNGIIKENDFKSEDYGRAATRAEVAYILRSALPDEALDDINDIDIIPDVNSSTSYSEYIYKLYRSGVLTGNGQKHDFAPERDIKRKELAAILVRLVDPLARKSFIIE